MHGLGAAKVKIWSLVVKVFLKESKRQEHSKSATNLLSKVVLVKQVA